MSSSTVYHKFLEAFACAHVSDGFMEDDGDRMLGYFMNMQGSSLSALCEVRGLKEKGNGFFRQNYFDRAAACYDEACKLLSLSMGANGGEDIQSLSDLAVSLNSNLAACALKLEEFRAASDLCSMILDTFPRNVKALFRRAVAYMKLNRFSEAETDLVEALAVEPRNKDVIRELDVVKGYLLIKENGKRVLEVASEDGVEGSNKKHVHSSGSVQVADYEMDIKDSESVKGSESVVIEEMEDHSDVSVNMEMADAQSTCGTDCTTNSEENEHMPNKSMLEFSKKGGGKSRLRISGQAYKKLLQGSKVNYYHKRELSTITIRILNNEVSKEGGILSDHCKKKRRRKRSKKRKLKNMVVKEDKSSSSHVNNVIHDTSSRASSICGASSFLSSSCDDFSPLVQENSTVVAPNSLVSLVTDTDNTTSFCSSAASNPNPNDYSPFHFSATPKRFKTSSFGKLSCAPTTYMFCRYPSNRHVSEKKRLITSKKNHSQRDESPRHNLSTFSGSRSFPRKFLRPRGVSVSCCRYSSEAQLIKKRKEVFAHVASSDRPLKKPFLFANPILSLVSFSSNVIINSDSESRVGPM